jgi:uncharacterized lipoprotein
MSILKSVLLGIQAILLGSLLGSLWGCGNQWVKDHSNDYTKAESHPPLKIPAKMNVQPFSEEYQIPDIKSEVKSEKIEVKTDQ